MMDSETQPNDTTDPLRILVIGLGGTISLALQKGRAQATQNLDALIATAKVSDLDAVWKTHSFCAKDSGDITLADLYELAGFVSAQSSHFDGFVITTGTDTLEDLAFGLDLLLEHRTTVVVTGAMRPPYAPDFDGIGNIWDAARLCLHACRKKFGVDIVMGGQVIAAEFAHKESISRLDGFVSTSAEHPAQRVSQALATVVANARNCALPLIDRSHLRGLNVPIIGTSLGGVIDVSHLKNVDGVIVACPGAASLSQGYVEAFQDHIKAGCPIVLVSRCAQSRADVSAHYPGYFDALEDMGFWVHDYVGLSPQKAYLRLATRLLSAPE